jgi:hypothetical protein
MGFGNYLAMILSLGSPLLLAKSHLFPSFFYRSCSEEAALTFFDGNPFQIRNGIIQYYEQLAGMIWLAGAVVLSQPFAGGWPARSLGGPCLDILGALGAGGAAWLVTMVLIKWRSARVYRPQMVERQRELFEQAAFMVTHEGRTPEQVNGGGDVPLASRQQRLAEAAQSLDQIGKLLDMPRKEHETDAQYVERLNPFFPS